MFIANFQPLSCQSVRPLACGRPLVVLITTASRCYVAPVDQAQLIDLIASEILYPAILC